MIRFVLFVLIYLCVNLSWSDSKEIRFNITPLSFPPYMVHEPLGGIMFDVLTQVAKKHGYRVLIQKVPENRVVTALSNNQLDVHASAIEWMPPSNAYVFTDPIVKVRDVVFMVSSHDFQLNGIESLFGHRLGVRTGYTYQSLDDHFSKGRISRIDSNSELYLLRMLENGRINLAVITEHVGLWLAAKNQFDVTFKYSKEAIDATNYRLVFSNRWQPFVEIFNQELAKMKNNGTLREIIERYR